ncbi:hypothetical protein DAEQUDRAFT_718875 [Daedalea quercina L-15889]|uniref:GST N-terminal domain-containing protein n=1 Tax=Daedalea quercina L-15889 TaxID=1314783 RepID=A0A165L4B3_9APHY|nr:hypothetical protein DAEQUDRAFT_718875 [Daedalea quercina L-15889]
MAAQLPETDVIIFYDIPSVFPGKAWSPNTWKTRYLLNLKGLPYRTQWVEYPDIVGLYKSFGLPPAQPGEVMAYTLPMIYDPRTKRAIADSIKIAAYLDDEYPKTPAVSPKELRAFQATFDQAFMGTLVPAIAPLFLPRQLPFLQPASQPHWRRTRELMLGCDKLEDVCPSEKYPMQWAEIERAMGVVAKWLDSVGDGRITYLGGDAEAGPRFTHSDLTIAGFVLWMRIVTGRESEEWRNVEGWHGGRWKKLLDLLEPYYDYSR